MLKMEAKLFISIYKESMDATFATKVLNYINKNPVILVDIKIDMKAALTASTMTGRTTKTLMRTDMAIMVHLTNNLRPSFLTKTNYKSRLVRNNWKLCLRERAIKTWKS
jgi:hypothetical protein